MGVHILITGAAGYIGGSLVADFLASKQPLLREARISASVRSAEQTDALSTLGVDVFRLDLSDEHAVTKTILDNNINMVIQTASSIDPAFSLPLIDALAEQKQRTGQPTYFIHTSGLSAFCKQTGWPSEQYKDTDPIFEIEKQLADSFPIRKTDVAVTEHADAKGVTSFIVVPSVVYGKGSGPWNKLSVVMPGYVTGAIKRERVYKFAEDIKVSGVHITDLTALYELIVVKALGKETLQHGRDGYYFALGHDIQWSETLPRLAATLQARDLVKDSEIDVWPSDGEAADAMGVPAAFVQLLWNSGEDLVTDNQGRLGWEPKWDKQRFLNHMHEEVQAVLDEGKAKSSLIDSLFKAAGQ